MSTEVARIPAGRRGLAKFKPEETKATDAKADAVIRYAKRVRDWPLLEKALDAKLDQQAEFVEWWREKVGVRHGGDTKNADRRSCLTAQRAYELTGITQQQVSKWAKRLAKRDDYRKALYGAAYKLAMGIIAGNLMSETNEWYTPAEYLESVRKVFGGTIDLDPASCALANKTVQAATFFTEKERGDNREWFGRVFLNPPYGVDKGESRAGKFCNKAITEYQAGRVLECIVLVNSVHAQNWQRPLYDFAVCLVDHRIAFADEHGDINPNPTFMNMFVYLGPGKANFAREFSKHGYVMERIGA